MKPFGKLSTKQQTFLLGILLALPAAAVAAGALHAHAAKTEATHPGASTLARPAVSTQRNIIAGESITLTPRGFEPAEISRPRGRFVLNINNRSGVHEVTFLLTHESGNRLRQVQFIRGKLSSREILDLPPGRYRLTEVNHPGWVVQIEISAQ